MSALTDALDELKTVIAGVAGITTVFENVPQGAPIAAELPAVVFEVKPATAPLLRTHTRAIRWPVDLWVLTEERGTDIEDSLPPVYDLPELILAAIDANGNLGGLLDRTVEFGEPAIGIDGERAFGPITMGETDYVGTIVHTVLTITRVGGFSS